MRQSDDVRTLDLPGLEQKPRRGRPPTGDAMTRAEVQKAYRERKKAAGVDFLQVAVDADVLEALHKYNQFKDQTLGEAVSRILRDRLLRKR